MAAPRKTHTGKTPSERREYVKNVTETGGPTATMLSQEKLLKSLGDATDEQMPKEEQDRYERIHRPPLAAEKKPAFSYITLLYTLIPIIAAYLGWLGYMTYSLNREVGETRIEIHNIKKIQEDNSSHLSEMRRKFEQLKESVDKLFFKPEGKSRK